VNVGDAVMAVRDSVDLGMDRGTVARVVSVDGERMDLAIDTLDTLFAGVGTAHPDLVRVARLGVWTPWATVWCVECDYAQIKDSQRAAIYARHLESISKMPRTALVTCPEGEMLALCDQCHCQCWTRDDVALLQRVGFAASELDPDGPFGWALEQTGGMCAALIFKVETATREIVATAMDGKFLLGEYHKDATGESLWEHPLRLWESPSFYRDDEIVSAPELESMVRDCARLVVEFARNPVSLDAVREEHQAAAGAKCHEGPDGMCVMCETEMTTCNACGGIAYHREGCTQI